MDSYEQKHREKLRGVRRSISKVRKLKSRRTSSGEEVKSTVITLKILRISDLFNNIDEIIVLE